jgi:hypothetical protein
VWSNCDTISSSRSRSFRSSMVGGVTGLSAPHSDTIAEPHPLVSCLATVFRCFWMSITKGSSLILAVILWVQASLAMAKLAFSSAWSRSGRPETLTRFCNDPASHRKKLLSEPRDVGESVSCSLWPITALTMLPTDCSVALTALSRFEVDVFSSRASLDTVARSACRACTATASA